jgi:deoxyribonuclease-4
MHYQVRHPGSYGKDSLAEGMARVARALDTIHQRTPGYKVRILLETTAGQGHIIGRRFEELRDLIGQTKAPERLGVCFDTCHVFAAGYELRTQEGYRATMHELEHVIGAKRVLAFHLNDSKGGLGSHVDRHQNIGEGQIGLDGFRWLLNDRRWRDRPMVIETEKSEDLHEDVENLRKLRGLMR